VLLLNLFSKCYFFFLDLSASAVGGGAWETDGNWAQKRLREERSGLGLKGDGKKGGSAWNFPPTGSVLAMWRSHNT
jgi:hypothetical protein